MARLQLLHACVRAVALGGELRDGRLCFLRGLALQLLRLVAELGAPRRLRRAPCRLLGLELGLGLGLGLGVGLE